MSVGRGSRGSRRDPTPAGRHGGVSELGLVRDREVVGVKYASDSHVLVTVLDMLQRNFKGIEASIGDLQSRCEMVDRWWDSQPGNGENGKVRKSFLRNRWRNWSTSISLKYLKKIGFQKNVLGARFNPRTGTADFESHTLAFTVVLAALRMTQLMNFLARARLEKGGCRTHRTHANRLGSGVGARSPRLTVCEFDPHVAYPDSRPNPP